VLEPIDAAAVVVEVAEQDRHVELVECAVLGPATYASVVRPRACT
jgi:hypothetical protein